MSTAGTRNIRSLDVYERDRPALPTQILDRHGRLITQFFRDQKRDIIRYEELPPHLIQALLTREDRHFFEHRGFRIPDTMRAAWNMVAGRFWSGGSTITQQLAGSIYADRREITIRRKLVELWWAIQLERWLTKNEILERYLNLVYFGEGTYGVEAASQFYFKHSARDITLAEAAMLVIQLNRPGGNSPINHPNRARTLQREILNQMVERGLTTAEEADLSFKQYWDNYDFTRSNRSTAFLERRDAAPYFSEYVRGRLDELMLGSMDVYQDGLIVRTTLDLDYQHAAQQTLSRHLERVNRTRSNSSRQRRAVADTTFLPTVDLLSLAFGIDGMRVAGIRERKQGTDRFIKELAPALDVFGMMLDDRDLRTISTAAYGRGEQEARRTQVEGALITLDARTGHILAMVGGSEFGTGNQFNRATQAKLQPGSAFKPLYYSAAISSGRLTPATMITDAPAIFVNDDGTPYIPLNYKGEWTGRVLLRTALARSMNVPSLKVLEEIGFDAAIERASRMLGVETPAEIEATFPRKYPLGLGVIAISPLQMARAYATFANHGQAVSPLAIQYVMDRNGRMVLEVEKELRARQRVQQQERQIMSPEAAYVMTDLLRSTVQWGTLRWASGTVGGFRTDTAGKTGTTQNWSDAWTVGFTPLQATALWMGFDERGETLGLNLTGATAAGPAWAEYMKAVEPGQAVQFARPATGLIEVTVNARSGLLPSGAEGEEIIQEIFLSGTDPKERDGLLAYESERRGEIVNNLRLAMRRVDAGQPLGVALDPLEPAGSAPPLVRGNAGTATQRQQPRGGNPLLD
ncbi:MAG: PBP1A family penicillin-binding protein [Spirochaetaceae bacterium]|nr:PBP1A family penicillin-binding protein [Spirochaetaceae bacterium]